MHQEGEPLIGSMFHHALQQECSFAVQEVTVPSVDPLDPTRLRLLSSRSGRRRYLLPVVGQSMVGAGIKDGDLLIIEEDEDPPDGTVVVALIRANFK
jgi:hypothetical protein